MQPKSEGPASHEGLRPPYLSLAGSRPGPPAGAPEPAVGQRLAPGDLYRLRRAHLAALESELRARLARQQADALTLELERRYHLLGRDATVDAHTGTIARADDAAGTGVSDGP